MTTTNPIGNEERARNVLAHGQLDQPSAAERERRQNEREDDPGDEQGQRLVLHPSNAAEFLGRAA
jgi:hypothetical protein